MNLLRHILVPVDFDEASQEALDQAVGLARTFNAALTIVHVVDIPMYAYSEQTFSTADLITPLENAARKQLDAAVARTRAEHPQTRGVLRRGGAYQEILSALEGARADLVVMGTHGRHGLAHALIGSVAAKMVRLSPVPVLTVHHRTNAANPATARRPIRKILVPTDFGKPAAYALDWAVDLAATLGASVTVVHAYEYTLLGMDAGWGIGIPDASQRLKRAAREALRETLEARTGRGVVMSGMVHEGIPWSEIVQLAVGADVDLIVMGTHGRRGVKRVLLGSVAEKVIRISPVPVLTLHAPPATSALARGSRNEEPTRVKLPKRHLSHQEVSL